jgi:pullulanase
MKEQFYSYLDGFNRVTVIYPKEHLSNVNLKKFYVLDEDTKIELTIKETIDLGREIKFICSLPESLSLNIEYTIVDEKQKRSSLRIGSIVRSDLFEMLYSYNKNDLGATYSKESTTFKVWSPTAKELELEIISPDGQHEYHDLISMPRGVWALTLPGDLDSYKYRYHVRINADFQTTTDPYGIASDANGKYNFVINPEKLYKFKYPKPEFSGFPVDAIIYELHVRDFTIDESINNPLRGKFLGLLEKCTTPEGNLTGLEYIKSLGVTHIQLQPIYDFGSVDELDPERLYNWGYDPVQYNVPEGWYSSNPNDPYTRINELRQLIDEIHHAGMRVIMDVVYNHVYDAITFPFNILVPGYFYRYDERGIITNVSGCGNDVASEKKMCSKFILDSVRYWMNSYNLDGFRFDLMGLLDVETITNALMIVKSADPAGMVYGEGWNMPSNIPEEMRANMNNYNLMPEVGFFNDQFRDKLKGSQWTKSLGFTSGGKTSYLDLLYLVTGSCIDNYLFSSPNQSINYVECHDNFTYFDFLSEAAPNMPIEQKKDYMALALSMVLVSQGVPFIHAGQEFFRTKNGVENSYKSSDEINTVYWERADENWEYVEMVRDLISIRNDYNIFRQDRKSIIKDRFKLSNRVNDSNSLCISGKCVDGVFYVIFKNNYEFEYFDFDTTMTLLFDGRRRVSTVCESVNVNKPGVYILLKGRE